MLKLNNTHCMQGKKKERETKSGCFFFFSLFALTIAVFVDQVEDFHAARQRLTAEMADNSNLMKSLVVRAEDARLMGDM